MTTNKKNRSLFLVILFFVLTSFTLIQLQSHKPTLFLIGDSTVRNGTKQIGNPLQGWGSFIGEEFDTTRIAVKNLAMGGTSSRTFITGGLWDKVLAQVQPGDYVIMQFGHNDGGPYADTARSRGSIKGNGEDSLTINNVLLKRKETVHTYGWYLRKYVAETRAKGATPYICSLIPRNNWKDGKVIRNDNDYAKWAREAAEMSKTGYIPLNQLIADKYDVIGKDSVAKFFPEPGPHTNAIGAIFNAKCVVDGLKAIKDCPLVKYLKK